jgi:tRNA-specific 2-thiouridylase
LGFDYVATGHYALNKKTKFKYKLLKAKDKNKDQSYFLWTLGQDELKHLLFPLSNYTKPEVRRLAKKFKLPTAEKAESQEICFIPEKSHNEFLKRHLKMKPGLIKLLTSPHPLLSKEGNRMQGGEVVGLHQGLPLYTIGQRKGIEIGGTGPYYAAKMDYKKNILYVVNDSRSPLIYKDFLIAKNVNWLAGVTPKLPLKCRAVIRYHAKPADCVITKAGKNYKIKFNEPQRAITPGQSVVFYGFERAATPQMRGAHANEFNNEEMMGGGVIV